MSDFSIPNGHPDKDSDGILNDVFDGHIDPFDFVEDKKTQKELVNAIGLVAEWVKFLEDSEVIEEM